MVFEHDYKKYPELTNAQMSEMGFSSPHKQITEDFRATIVKVHDGDTVTLRTGFRDFDFPLRLSNINAPEMSEGGEQTKEWLREKIFGREVQIIIDKNNRVGKYGRLLGRILYYGLDIGQEELHLGLAKPFGKKNEGELPTLKKEINIKKWL